MKKFLCLVLALVAVMAICSGCASNVETLDAYRVRVEEKLDKAKEGFDKAVESGDYTLAMNIRDSYIDTFIELKQEMSDLVEANKDDQKAMEDLRSKCMALEGAMKEDIQEMTEGILDIVANAYGSNSQQYESLLKEYNEMLKNIG